MGFGLTAWFALALTGFVFGFVTLRVLLGLGSATGFFTLIAPFSFGRVRTPTAWFGFGRFEALDYCPIKIAAGKAFDSAEFTMIVRPDQ